MPFSCDMRQFMQGGDRNTGLYVKSHPHCGEQPPQSLLVLTAVLFGFRRFRPFGYCWHILLSISGRNKGCRMVLDIRSRWNEVKGRLRQQYEMLSEADLALRVGHEGDLMGRLQKKLGKSRADILKMIGEA